MDAPVRQALARVSLLIVDVDGVLTDGTLYYGPEGEVLKAFHVKDGLGLKLLQAEGVAVSVITAKTGGPLARRLCDLGLTDVKMGREDKAAALGELLAERDASLDEVAFVGDDLPDLPVLRRVGAPIAVADAHSRVRAEAAWVTETRGGRGAVREVADAILEAKGRLDDAVARYLRERGS